MAKKKIIRVKLSKGTVYCKYNNDLTSEMLHFSSKSTVCPGSSDPFDIVSYYIKWVTTPWTHSIRKIL